MLANLPQMPCMYLLLNSWSNHNCVKSANNMLNYAKIANNMSNWASFAKF